MADNPTRRHVVTGSALAAAGAGLAAGPTNAHDAAPASQAMEGKTAFITGAARGFGRATAIAFAKAGANVALIDIADPEAMRTEIGYPLGSRSDLDETVRLVEAEGAAAIPVICDVRDRAGLRDAARQTVERFGGIDSVIANAGVIITQDTIDHYDPARWHALMAVNVYGVMNTVEATLDALRTSGEGRIVIVSSMAGRAGTPLMAYGMSKWAVTGLMKNLAVMLGGDGISVNCVAPGMADTDMPFFMLGVERNEEGRRALGDRQTGNVLPSGRLLDPQEIAEVILMAAGPATGRTSGASFEVNHGNTARGLG